MALFPHAFGRDGFSPVFTTLLSCISWLVSKTHWRCSEPPAGSWQPSATPPPSLPAQQTSTTSLSAVRSAPGCPVSSAGDPRCRSWAGALAAGHCLSPLGLLGRRDVVLCSQGGRWGWQVPLSRGWSEVWEARGELPGGQSCWVARHQCSRRGWHLLGCFVSLGVLGIWSSVGEKTFLWRALGAGTHAQPSSVGLALTAQPQFPISC